jgi:hypothetical protein
LQYTSMAWDYSITDLLNPVLVLVLVILESRIIK